MLTNSQAKEILILTAERCTVCILLYCRSGKIGDTERVRKRQRERRQTECYRGPEKDRDRRNIR